MRTIHKNAEPPTLAQHRCAPHANYDNLTAVSKDDLRRSLASEQRGLCCYCMSRIRPTADQMKIAHWHAQSTHPAEQLDYGNLLGACLGNPGQPSRMQHCDASQGNRDVSRNPANPAHQVESLIHYLSDGRIQSDNRCFNSELNDVLNLNAAFLTGNRKAVLDGFAKSIRNGPLQRSTLERWIRNWNGDNDAGELRPYCQVVVYWHRKRLDRL